MIQDMYQREVERIKAGQLTRIPKLKESFIVRDSWTRLNVMPSKVMQVLIVLIDNELPVWIPQSGLY